MRRALILCIAAAALPTAPAVAWQEVPFRALPGDEVATCLRATGSEGGLAALGPVGRRSAPTDLLATGSGAPAVRERVRFRVVHDCAAVREQGGAGVAAAPVNPLGRRRREMRAAVRDPGGRFGAPVALGPMSGAYDAEVSGHGDALVAWIQGRGQGSRGQVRVVVSRRASGGPFEPPVGLTPWRPTSQFGPERVAVAVDPDGLGTVAWALRSQGSSWNTNLFDVEAAAAQPGAPFGPAQLLTSKTRFVRRISLAVAPGGAALLAHEGNMLFRLFERAPGAAGFGPARDFGDAGQRLTEPALALRGDGAGVVAWRGGAQDDAVQAMTRPAGGAFGPVRELARGRGAGSGTGLSSYFLPRRDRAFAPLDQTGLSLRAVVSAAGHVALAWTAPRPLPDAPLAAMVATGTLDGSFGPPSALGSPARSVAGVAALVLPGGEPAVAWADNVVHTAGFGAGELEPPTRGGRIHLARADAPAGPARPPPAARLRAPRVQRIYPDEAIRVQVRCAAACDVRAFVPEGGASGAGAAASLAGGGSRVLRMLPTGDGDPVPRRRGRVTVRARISAPGSPATRTLRLRVRLERRPPLPVPRPVDARAVRRGRSIVVTWRTAFPARRVTFVVDYPAIDELFRVVEGSGRSRFKLTLHPKRPSRVHRLKLTGTSPEGLQRRSVTVPVTR